MVQAGGRLGRLDAPTKFECLWGHASQLNWLSCNQTYPRSTGIVSPSTTGDYQDVGSRRSWDDLRKNWKSAKYAKIKIQAKYSRSAKKIPSPPRSAATICVEIFLDPRIGNHVRFFAKSVEDLQYTLADFSLFTWWLLIALIAATCLQKEYLDTSAEQIKSVNNVTQSLSLLESKLMQ